MYRSSTAGLGAMPTCVTQAELNEAALKCPWVNQTLRGIGAVQHGDVALAPMSGRLAAFSPCQVANLSVCPPPHAALVNPAPAAPRPQPVFDMYPPPAAPGAQTSDAATVGVMGILALLAVAGGGYYLYRRYK